MKKRSLSKLMDSKLKPDEFGWEYGYNITPRLKNIERMLSWGIFLISFILLNLLSYWLHPFFPNPGVLILLLFVSFSLHLLFIEFHNFRDYYIISDHRILLYTNKKILSISFSKILELSKTNGGLKFVYLLNKKIKSYTIIDKDLNFDHAKSRFEDKATYKRLGKRLQYQAKKYDLEFIEIAPWKYRLSNEKINYRLSLRSSKKLEFSYLLNNTIDFELYLTNEGRKEELKKVLGAQDLTVGNEIIDNTFFIQSNQAQVFDELKGKIDFDLLLKLHKTQLVNFYTTGNKTKKVVLQREQNPSRSDVIDIDLLLEKRAKNAGPSIDSSNTAPTKLCYSATFPDKKLGDSKFLLEAITLPLESGLMLAKVIEKHGRA